MRLFAASAFVVLSTTCFFACVGSDPVGSGTPTGTDAQASPDTSVAPVPPDASVPDGSTPPPPPVDGGSDGTARSCNLTAPFGNVRPVPGLEARVLAANSLVKQWLDASLTDDERLMFFSACQSSENTDPSCDIYQGTMSGGAVADVRRLDTLSSGNAFERHPTISNDAKRLFLLRGPRIFTASRTDPLAAFGAPVAVDSLDVTGGQFDTDPFLGRSGKLYFMRGTASPRVVHYATVSATSIDGARQLAPDLQGLDPIVADVGNEKESLIFLAKVENGRRVVYTSERSGATWSALGQSYVGAINEATSSNFVNWVSADGCRLYFSRGQSVSGPFRIMQAERPR